MNFRKRKSSATTLVKCRSAWDLPWAIKKKGYLFLIYLERTEEVICAGVLITRDLLLTARKCVVGPVFRRVPNLLKFCLRKCFCKRDFFQPIKLQETWKLSLCSLSKKTIFTEQRQFSGFLQFDWLKKVSFTKSFSETKFQYIRNPPYITISNIEITVGFGTNKEQVNSMKSNGFNYQLVTNPIRIHF